jgi:hypothetical protein
MRLRRALSLSLLFATALCAGGAAAQASRTWVSGVGDDANPCSRTAPCKTFAGAISKTAAGGEIDALDPAGFGAVTITKAITIDGGGGIVASVLVAGTNGIIVNAGASDVVTLRNIQIEGLGTGLTGVSFIAGAALHVQNVAIRDFTAAGIDFHPSSGASKLFVTGSSVQKSQGGIKVDPSSPGAAVATIQDTLLNGNATYGLRVEANASAVAKNVTADGNLNGFYVTDTTGENPVLSLENCVSAHNSNVGIRAGFGGTGLAKILLSNTSVFENGTGMQYGPNGQIQSFGNNKVFGNGTDGAPSGTIPQS